MSDKLKRLKQEMIIVYGSRCWLALEEYKKLTGHHIIPLRDCGPTEWCNIALLGNDSHVFFNEIELYYPNIARVLNGMFYDLNRTYKQATKEYEEEIKRVLKKVH